MDNTEPTRICEQCHKEVAESNFALHEPHCRRFLCLCPDCDEPVPRDHLTQHREEQHTQVNCSKCNKKVERCHLEDHESEECEERLQCCEYCQLELPVKDLKNHTVACGSRTERCLDCGSYVILKNQLDHAQTCNGTKPASVPTDTTTTTTTTAPKTRQDSRACTRFMASFPAEDIDGHEQVCIRPSWKHMVETEEEKTDEEGLSEEASPQLSSTLKAAAFSHTTWRGEEADPYQISTCAYCHLALPLLTLRWHEAKCKIYIHLK